jgi:Double zinc ribbon
MRCPSCHHDKRSDRRFCTQCGTELAVGCPSCGAPIEVGEKFCGGCGAALTIGGRTTTPSPAHAPLLAEKIRQAKATVEGERKQVTGLFVVSGAKSYEPVLHVERAELARLTGDEVAWGRELREAHRLFTEIGAPIRAAAVAREIGL